MKKLLMNVKPNSVPGPGLLALKFVLAGCLANAAQIVNDFTPTGSLTTGREYHTATQLPNGKVLVVGGEDDDGNTFASAELYDPATGAWTPTGSMGLSCGSHTATLLPNGKVLVAGGEHYAAGVGLILTNTRLYNPASGSWSSTGSMGSAREHHTATLVPNGKVLVAGGESNYVSSSTAELYDPTTGAWSATGSLGAARYEHTATLLPNGKILVAGGAGTNGLNGSAELYDPVTGTWSPTGSLGAARYGHTAMLLPNGKVLIAGGFGAFGPNGSAELYDPASGTWSATGSMGTARENYTATLLPTGKVLVAGGDNYDNPDFALTTAELYDPATGTWSATDRLGNARDYHTATLLPNGKVLIAGGEGYSSDPASQYLTGVLSGAELYEPAPSVLNPVVSPRKLGDGSYQFFFSGNPGCTNYRVLASTVAAAPMNSWLELGPPSEMPPGSGQFQFTDTQAPNSSLRFYRLSLAVAAPGANEFNSTGSLITGRVNHTATLLLNGKVLVVGGWGHENNYDTVLGSAELYDPATGTWSPTGSLSDARTEHTATLLANGKVLVAGGFAGGGTLVTAELYDPVSGTWSATGSLGTPRYYHTATLLADGKVLVAGGGDSIYHISSSTELYDPATGAWSPTGNAGTGRDFHTATLLPNGKVLVAGGSDSSATVLASAELYDPAAGTWSPTGSLNASRKYHTATLLANGKVLVAGGSGLASSQLYDPASGSWSSTGSLGTGRFHHTATLLANGKVLVAGGNDGIQVYDNLLNRGELYNPSTGTWSPTGSLVTARTDHQAILLANAKVLVVGGQDNATFYSTRAELYEPAK